MALFGYSQGAQIITNSLCGLPAVWAADALTVGTITGKKENVNLNMITETMKPLSRGITKNLASIMLFGDPSHSGNASYAFGNGTGTGLFRRGNISECEALGPRLRSYCLAGDPYCDENGAPVSLTSHLVYVPTYGAEIAPVVVDQFRNSPGASRNGSSPGAMPTNIVAPGAADAISSSPMLALAAVFIVLGVM